VQENAVQAGVNGLEAFAMTDHGPALEGASTLLHFWNMKVIPEYVHGIRVIKGAEANILDYSGTLDITEECLSRLEFINASYHDITIKPGTAEEHTAGLIQVLKNPYVDAIAHPGNPTFQVDIDRVVRTAGEYGKLIEINNSSFKIRKGCEDNCAEFIRKCRKYGVRITCGSDAHISFDVGRFDNIRKLLEEADMPEELVISASLARMEEYLKERKASKKALRKVK
jgi:putative hydrolase